MRNHWKKVGPITGNTGKWVEGERVADGSVVVMKSGNADGAKGPCCGSSSTNNMEGKDEMTNASINLQDLRRGIYVKAKAEPSWRFWGLYVHVCKMETLNEAYSMARKNNGAPGIDGVTFEDIEDSGVWQFLRQIRDELTARTYKPLRARKKEIPKDGGRKCARSRFPQSVTVWCKGRSS